MALLKLDAKMTTTPKATTIAANHDGKAVCNLHPDMDWNPWHPDGERFSELASNQLCEALLKARIACEHNPAMRETYQDELAEALMYSRTNMVPLRDCLRITAQEAKLEMRALYAQLEEEEAQKSYPAEERTAPEWKLRQIRAMLRKAGSSKKCPPILSDADADKAIQVMSRALYPASDKQMKLLTRLMTEAGLDYRTVGKMSSREASARIDQLSSGSQDVELGDHLEEGENNHGDRQALHKAQEAAARAKIAQQITDECPGCGCQVPHSDMQEQGYCSDACHDAHVHYTTETE